MATFFRRLMGKLRGDEQLPKAPFDAAFGHKTITMFGGLCLLIGNLTGPGMVSIPLLFQQAGWFPPLLVLIGVCILSTLAAGFLCEAMCTIPGNEFFQSRIEFATLTRFFFGKWGLLVSQFFVNVSLQATNMASIIISAQVMDDTIVAIFGKSCAARLYPDAAMVCVDVVSQNASPFGDSGIIISIGFLVILAMCIPLAFLNLDDNIWAQQVAFFTLFLVLGTWIWAFARQGLSRSPPPAVGSDQGSVLGSILFNYGFVTSVPSWCNEKRREVSVNKSLWSSTIVCTTLYFIIGFMGASAFPNMASSSDILSVINGSKEANSITRASVYLFPLSALISSIPVFSIIVRYNLMQSKICKKPWANFWAVCFPWIFVIPFMTGSGLQNIINWGSLFFNSMANFIIPLLIFIKASYFKHGDRELNEEQRRVLFELQSSLHQSEKNMAAALGKRREAHHDSDEEDEDEEEIVPFAVSTPYTAFQDLPPISPHGSSNIDGPIYLTSAAADAEDERLGLKYHVIPYKWERFLPPRTVAILCAAVLAIVIASVIIIDLIQEAQGNSPF